MQAMANKEGKLPNTKVDNQLKDTEKENEADKNNSEKKKGANPDAEICRNFCNNRCTRGDLCKYRHPKNITVVQHERTRSRSPIDKENVNRSNVCRDFLRNMCTRGKECRYFHPDDEEREKKSWFTLCYDFQNGKCSRHDCRYFHLTFEDEELFRETGEISLQIISQAMRKALILDVATKSNRPTCKDYLKGLCKLRTCRYRHVSRREYEDDVYKSLTDELHKQLGPKKKQEKGPLMNYGPPRSHEGPYNNMMREDRNEGGGRVGPGPPPPFDNNFMPGPMERDNYPPPPQQGGPPFGMRGGGPEFHGRPPSAEFQREIRPRDMDSLRNELSDLQNHMYQMRQEKEDEIMELKNKLNRFRDSASFDSNYDQGSYDNLRASNENAMKLNRELQMDIKMVHKQNEELLRDLKASKNWEQIYTDTKLELQSVHMENQESREKSVAQDLQIASLKSEIKSWERHENFIKEQVYKLQNQLLLVEGELSQSWGGGPPPLASQVKAWNNLKTGLLHITNPNTSSKEEEVQAFTNNGTSYNSGSDFTDRNNTWIDSSNSYSGTNATSYSGGNGNSYSTNNATSYSGTTGNSYSGGNSTSYLGTNSNYSEMYDQSRSNSQSRGRIVTRR